uniref:AlNc14C262G9829 protein n=1 Tax=Albugo laibachii Nc14 TaxID=890382 RepID=F0WU06_9STRA|nr:AlNc14C262G9829 [Albugo laibachii Nc14]|eukprot:CCA24850.1 AlNc14C262G9829 [Albugo laibachii Nc14]
MRHPPCVVTWKVTCVLMTVSKILKRSRESLSQPETAQGGKAQVGRVAILLALR